MKNIHYYNSLLEDWESNNNCIIWDRGLVEGYAEVHKKVRGHRMSLELKLKRPIKRGYMARHLCHKRACINPKHIIEGTHQDNMDDMIIANRQAKGQLGGNNVLEEVEVLSIVSRLKMGERASELATEYKVSKSAIHGIKFGGSWDWLTGASRENPISSTSRAGVRNSQSKLSEEQVKEIKHLLRTSNLTHKEIAKIYEVSRITITKIKSGRLWSHIL